MARKLKPGADTSGDAPAPKKRGRPRNPAPPPSSNVTDETIREFCDKAAVAHGEFETAVGEMKQKQGVYRGVLKDAKKAGVDQHAITWWIGARKREPDEIDRETRSRNRVAKLMNLPIGTQLGLFDDGRTVATTIEDGERAETREGDADYFDGLEAGKAGKPISTCKHAEDTPGYEEFLRGWKEGQYTNVQAMSGGSAGSSAH